MDDACTRLPKAHTIALTRAQQKIVDFLIFLDCDRQIALDAELGANEVVRMDRAGHCRIIATGQHELQNRHLRSSVLHSHPVGIEVDIAFAAHRRCAGHFGHVGEQNLLGQGKRTPHQTTSVRLFGAHGSIYLLDHCRIHGHGLSLLF